MGQTAAVHVAVVVPGGVDPSRRERVIPALHGLVGGLAARHQVTVVTLGQHDRARRWDLDGVTVIDVPAERPGPHRLARIVARGIAAVGSQGRPDLVHGLWASVSGLVAVGAAARWRVPSLVHVAGGELVAMADLGYGGALGRGGRWITRTCLQRADMVTVASGWLADHVRAAGHRVDAEVPLGADPAWFAVAKPADPAPRFVQVASLNRIKDHATALAALALVRRTVPDAHLDLVGVDTLDGAVLAQARRLGLEGAVRWHGLLTPDEVPAVVRGAVAHLVTSRHEAGPVALMEAAAAGVPTLGTAVGHVHDLAHQELPAAVAVPVGDANGLAGAMVRAHLDRSWRDALAVQASEFSTSHDMAWTVGRFDELYNSARRR